MIRLFIDTKNNKKIIIKLDKNGKIFVEEYNYNKQKAEITLVLLEKILKKSKVTVSDIDKIYAEKGSGSFTGLRIGVSIANALSFLLNKPVNDKKIGEMEIPTYE